MSSTPSRVGFFPAAAALLLPLLWGCVSFHGGPLAGAPASNTFVEVDNTRMRYLDIGEGPVVVLLHGFAGSIETWDQVVPELSQHYRVIAIDLKGFGWSDRPAGDYSPAAQAALVFGVLDKLEVEDAAVVAHSWGSSVALAMAIGNSERVRGLALYDAWVYEDQIPIRQRWGRSKLLGRLTYSVYFGELGEEWLYRAFYDERFVTEKRVSDFERRAGRPGSAAAALATARGQRFERMQTHYKTIKQPALVLWGREDKISSLRFGRRLATELPSARLAVYDDCGHMPMIEAAESSTKELARFLAQEVY